MVVFSSRLHEKTTLVVPFGGYCPQDGEAWWPWDLHLDRLQGFLGPEHFALSTIGFYFALLGFSLNFHGMAKLSLRGNVWRGRGV